MDVLDLETVLEQLNLNAPPEKTAEAVCLPFQPSEDLAWVKAQNLNSIDRYLYRIFDHRSDGLTNEVWVKSRDACMTDRRSTQDVFARSDKNNVAELVNRHLRWDYQKYKLDNLVSWTSSMLFALQYAFYRNSKHGTPLSQIKLCMVDTKYLPANVVIKDMGLIDAFAEHDESGLVWDLPSLQLLRNKRHSTYVGSFYFGEYLSQGALKIEGHCKVVTIQKLVQAGLTRLRPELPIFNNVKEHWANKVIAMRQTFSPMSEGSILLPDSIVDGAISIGDLFGPRWKLPMTTAFLALENRQGIGDVLRRAFNRHPELLGMFNSCPRKESTNRHRSRYRRLLARGHTSRSARNAP